MSEPSYEEIKKLPTTTDQKKRAFLEAYRNCGTMRGAASSIGINHTTAYDWKNADSEFKEALEIARIDAGEALEDEARRRAYKGSDVLLIFLLKGFFPGKYKEGKVQVQNAPTVNISADLQKLDPSELSRIREAVYRIRSNPHEALPHEGGKVAE